MRFFNKYWDGNILIDLSQPELICKFTYQIMQSW
jgi:hypothetical protein